MRLTHTYVHRIPYTYLKCKSTSSIKNVLSHNDVIDVIHEINPCRIKTYAMTLTLTLTMTSSMTFRLKEYETKNV